jgi:4-aminobutyrate aminotransferase / (S)-3-amino-2-methylpropionate transaminase / 5-aminovalerate transaminase
LSAPYTVGGHVSVHERTTSERVQEARERYVARGISTPPLVVERAEGARIWDVDGREYIDFAGGLGCANLGHSLPAVVDAVHAQVDRYLHQCFRSPSS